MGIPYESGEIKVVAAFDDGTVLTEKKYTSTAPTAVKLTMEEEAAAIDDVAIVTCSILDTNPLLKTLTATDWYLWGMERLDKRLTSRQNRHQLRCIAE